MKRFSKLLSVLLAVAMIMAIAIPVASVSADDKVTIAVETVSADAGATKVEVKVFMTAEPHWSAVGFVFNFDPNKLTYKKWAWNPALNEQTLNGENNVSMINKENAATTGELIVAYTTTVQLGGYEGYYPVNEDGDEFDYIGTLTFDVKAGVVGAADIEVSIDKLARYDGVDIPYETSNGAINIAVPPHDHVYDDWTVTKEATCTEEGERSRACTICGEKETEVIAIDENAHTWGDWEVVEEPAIGKNGLERRYCLNNQAHFEEREIDALEGIDIRVETVQAKAGDKKVEVKVYINYEPHWSAVGFTFNFDPAKLVYKSWKWNAALNEQTLNGENNVSMINKENAATTGELVVAYTTTVQLGGYEGYYPVNEDGDEFDYIGTLTFDVKDDADAGLADIEVVIDKLARYDGADVAYATTNGGIDIVTCDHDWVEIGRTEATCTEPGSITYACSICTEEKTEEIEALGHDLGEWEVTTEPTCTEAGVETRTCSRCDYSEEREVEALGHDYTEEVTEPTCEEGGYTTHTCSRCGDTYTDNETEALGHDWGEWEVTTESTCAEYGVETRTCGRCGATEDRDLTELLDHTWGEWEVTTEPTCTDRGEETRTCEVCGETETRVVDIDPDAHEWVEIGRVEATCEEDGVIYYACLNDAEHTKEEPIPATGHAWGEPTYEWSDDNLTCTATRVCENDPEHVETETVRTVADVTDPTCEEAGHATYTATFENDAFEAQTKELDMNPLGHDWGEWETVEEATCTEGGLESRTCNVCQETEEREIEALGHDYEEVVTEPTCTEGGYTTYTCSRCGDTYTDDETDALGHDWSEWEVTTEPTCEEAGVETRVCARCQETEEREVEALGHDWSEWEVTVEPTCEEAGVENRTCSRCDAAEEREVEALGHDWGEPSYEWADDFSTCTATVVCGNNAEHVITETVRSTSEDVDVSCTEDGGRRYTATFEDDHFEDQTKYEEGAVPALGHDWGDWEVTKEATCTEAGEQIRTCARCQETETEEIEALGHDWGEWETTKEATCEEAGEETRTCARCQETETREIEALGHDWSEWEVTTEPTCTEKGEETRTCSRCGAMDTREVEALGHNYEEAVTEPTCTEGGYTTHTCSRCGDSYTDNETEALGHDWSDWEVTKEATCTEAAVETRTCGRCQTTEEREGAAALGHDWGEWVVTTEADCEVAGVETRTCNRCQETETRETEPLGHIWGEPTYEWSDDYSTCTATRVCTRHEQRKAEPHIETETVNTTSETVLEATCTEDGKIVYTATFTNEAFATQTKEVAIPALGHDFGEWTVSKEATCTEAGEETRTCSRCDVTETREVEAIGHDYQAVVTEPTCTEAGYTTHTCSHCGDSYTDNETAALGHDFGEWKVTKAATCTEKGEETRTCSRCEATETREVEALDHDWGEWEVTKEATNEAEGEETRVCKRDSSHIETRTIEKIPYEEPEITEGSVEDGATYDIGKGEKPAPTWEPEDAPATLDGKPYERGTEITEPGEHTLVITNGDKTTTIKFTVTDSSSSGENENTNTSDIAIAGIAIIALIASAAVVVIARKKRFAK